MLMCSVAPLISHSHTRTRVCLIMLVPCVFLRYECVVKILAQGSNPLGYWLGGDAAWNNFDFWLVLISWLPMGGNGQTSF